MLENKNTCKAQHRFTFIGINMKFVSIALIYVFELEISGNLDVFVIPFNFFQIRKAAKSM